MITSKDESGGRGHIRVRQVRGRERATRTSLVSVARVSTRREGVGRKSLTATPGQQFTIGDDVIVSITKRRDGRVHLVVEAPLATIVSDLTPVA